jgi:hypothetical protein
MQNQGPIASPSAASVDDSIDEKLRQLDNNKLIQKEAKGGDSGTDSPTESLESSTKIAAAYRPGVLFQERNNARDNMELTQARLSYSPAICQDSEIETGIREERTQSAQETAAAATTATTGGTQTRESVPAATITTGATIPRYSLASNSEEALAGANNDSNQRSVTAERSNQQQQPRKRKIAPGTTTARHAKKPLSMTKIRIGCRVYIAKSTLKFLLSSDEQKQCLNDFRENHRIYGTVLSGASNKGYNVEFDILPSNQKKVHLTRKRLTVVKDGEEEQIEEERINTVNELSEINIDENEDDDEQETGQTARTPATTRKRQGRKGVYQQSIDSFINLDQDILRETTSFELNLNDNSKLEWKILGDQEFISKDEDPLVYPDELRIQADVSFSEQTLSEIWFQYFLPCIEGHALLMDEYLSNQKAPYYITAKTKKVKFHRPDDEDSDWIVKQCYMLIIAAVTEAEVGVDNLWKQGEGGGRRDHANFGRYVPIHYFKMFLSCAPYLFCEKKYWYESYEDKGWEVFQPVMNSFNDRRRRLFAVTLLMLDESMSGWRPKTSKFGGLPNLTFEPRKPVPLGTQFKNGVECISGILAFQDPVIAPEKQKEKGFFYSEMESHTPEKTSLPLREDIPAHTAEVLRQVSGAGVTEGGWVGGDAWFGSVCTCVEVMKRMKVYSTFIVKNNRYLFPMEALHAVLKARHGSRPAGHWVVMTTEISDVKLIAIAYAWSQNGVAYFISTCGSTEPCPIKYESKFEDEWGITNFREYDRPEIVHFLYEYLPLIDEHNKQRQSILCLEKRWLTQDPWFRLLTTIVGMSVVDFHRLYRFHELKGLGSHQDEVDSMRIIKFTDLICKDLRLWEYKQQRRNSQNNGDVETNLERCRDVNGFTDTDPTQWQIRHGYRVGNPVVLTCYICRRYLDNNGKQYRRNTSFWCKACHMPICKQDKTGMDGGREQSCYEEHITSNEHELKCKPEIMHNRGSCVPNKLHLCLHKRRSSRSRR